MSRDNEDYRETDNKDGTPYVQRLEKPKTMALSVLSLVTGVLAVLCGIFGWVGILFAIASLALAYAARLTLGYFDKIAMWGIILSIFGFVFGAFSLFFFLATKESFLPWVIETFSALGGR